MLADGAFFSGVVFLPYIKIPHPRSHQELQAADFIEEIFPVGLGNSQTNTVLNLCRKPGVSSFLLPRHSFLSRFPSSERFDVVAQETIKLSTLDKCLMDRWRECDFIKIDTQGSGLGVLHGGDAFIDKPIIGLEVEVEFVRMYEE